MKQILITIVLLFLILCFACKKHETIETAELPKNNSAQLISNSKGKSYYGVTALVGHAASGCSGCMDIAYMLTVRAQAPIVQRGQ